MKTTVNKIENNANLINVIKSLKPRQFVDKKLYPAYHKDITDILENVYKVYQAREQGKPINESEVRTKITEFLHTLGKANGKYISVCEATKDENGKATVFFDTLVYHSYKHRIFTTSKALAQLESEKKKASTKKNEAHKKLIEGKGTATAYKEAVKNLADIEAKIIIERNKDNAEDENKVMESPAKFVKFVTLELKSIIKNRYALSTEEAEALRKIHNKETKAKRNEAKPKAEAKKPATAKPRTTKTEAKTITESEKKTA